MTQKVARVGWLAALAMIAAVPAGAETTLLQFSGANGVSPRAALVRDAQGNFYGTTYAGGRYNRGTVFELSPPAAGATKWRDTTLYSFGSPAKPYDPAQPEAPLTIDSKGDLFGTTYIGGDLGYGTVFVLRAPRAGQTQRKLRTLYSFTRGSDGGLVSTPVILDAAGNLYGTTPQGGQSYAGTVYELSPGASKTAAWTLTNLFTFDQADGQYPSSGLTFDGAGNLYGETLQGGLSFGVVYKLAPPAAGVTQWGETIIHEFGYPNDFDSPAGGLTFDTAGNLFGTASFFLDTQGDPGGVFKFSPPTGSATAWTESFPHLFIGNSADGAAPASGVIIDGSGNLFGTTPGGGTLGNGIVYELLPTTSGGTTSYVEKILTDFPKPLNIGGSMPLGGLAFDSAGLLYGTTSQGGTGGCLGGYGAPIGCGTVFSVMPR